LILHLQLFFSRFFTSSLGHFNSPRPVFRAFFAGIPCPSLCRHWRAPSPCWAPAWSFCVNPFCVLPVSPSISPARSFSKFYSFKGPFYMYLALLPPYSPNFVELPSLLHEFTPLILFEIFSNLSSPSPPTLFPRPQSS